MPPRIITGSMLILFVFFAVLVKTLASIRLESFVLFMLNLLYIIKKTERNSADKNSFAHSLMSEFEIIYCVD